MNCPYCNSPIRPGALFCTECGKKLPEKKVCPHCEKTYESVTTICPFCGKDSEAPVEKPATTPVAQQNTVAPTPQAPTQTKQSKKSRRFWPIVIGGALIMTLVYGIAVFYGVNDFLGNKKSEEPVTSDDRVTSSSSSNDYDSSNSSSSSSNNEYNSGGSSNQSSNYENSSSNNHATTQYLTLIGSIDGKYPITMDLNQNGSELSGSYYYNKNGPDKRLTVYGQLDGSRFRLQEYDDDNNNTGNFVGTYHNGMVTGTFTLSDGKTMSFDLEVVN